MWPAVSLLYGSIIIGLSLWSRGECLGIHIYTALQTIRIGWVNHTGNKVFSEVGLFLVIQWKSTKYTVLYWQKQYIKISIYTTVQDQSLVYLRLVQVFNSPMYCKLETLQRFIQCDFRIIPTYISFPPVLVRVC